MKISIIIPVYNVEAYLEECVQSVLPLRADFEILLVDDGSTDQSGALCDRLAKADGRIRVIHQENGGLSAARNSGIRAAVGEYLFFLDSDDFWDTDAAERLLAVLNETPDVAMGLYRNYYTAADSYENEQADGFLSVSGVMPIDRFLDAVPEDGQTCYMVACRFAVRRSLILENDLFFLPGIYHEDEEWTARLFSCAETMAVTHEYFYQYRQAREGAITGSVKPKHLRDIFTIMESTRRLLDAQPDKTSKKRYLQARLTGHFLNNLVHLPLLRGEEWREAIRTMSEYRPLCEPHLCGKIGTLAKRLLPVFGIGNTARLLHAAYRALRTLKR